MILQECPGCHYYTCYYLGMNTVECDNRGCRFYKPRIVTNRSKFSYDKRYEETAQEEKKMAEENKKKVIIEEDTEEIDITVDDL